LVTSDGETLYMIYFRRRNTGALVAVELATDKATVIGSGDKVGIDEAERVEDDQAGDRSMPAIILRKRSIASGDQRLS